ncbi:stabilizer of axonemal microtubules 1-like [Anguilla anguilla]|uniref:stabilizer of axonemal microtubules 1-like n=1 Tax=Anguilla anguilla TaxID=7936 RepID=UPI0015AD96E2|nr:stabilizer of axonemal microtubules 1-like [Anguilla anguilla]
MAIRSFSVAGSLRPGYALQNTIQRPYKTTESKTSRHRPPGERFTTSYRADYRNWATPKPESLKPPDNLTRSDAKFQAITSYQADYGYKTSADPPAPEGLPLQSAVPYALQYMSKPAQPSKSQGAIYAPNASAQFGGDVGSAPRRQRGEEPSSVLPTKAAREAAGVGARHIFAHSTEYKDNYRAWPTSPVYQCAYPSYDPPKGTMQFVTSYAWDYRPWGDQTRPNILQREQFLRPQGSFQHTTTYLADYTSKVATPSRTRLAQRR